MNKIKIAIKAKHLKDVNYGSCTNCPLAKAAKEQLKTNNINVGGTNIRVDKVIYTFDHDNIWYPSNISKLSRMAKEMNPEYIVINLELTKKLID